MRIADNSAKLRIAGVCAVVVMASSPVPTIGQSPLDNFGGQSRADAASKMLVLAVQQGISTLPPTAGQSFSYKLDPELGTFVPDEGRLEPVSFRSTQVIQPGTFSVRAAASFFHLDDSFGPILYQGEPSNGDPNFPIAVSEFGTNVEADIFLMNIALNYGLMDRLEISLNLPLVVVDADASQTFVGFEDEANLPANRANVAAAETPGELDELLAIGRDPSNPEIGYIYRKDSFSELGFDFNDGSNFGVGRISLGGKYLVYSSQLAQLAVSSELFFPSPNEDEFAGSESFALLPRVIGRATPLDMLRLHADLGYDFDFEEDELSRFVWSVGSSLVPLERLVLDAGFGGSVFKDSVRWTPTVTQSSGDPGEGTPPLTLTALEGTEVGDTFVDFLAGAKVKVTDMLILSGAVNVPINDEGFRPNVVGTFSAELYF